MALRSILLRTSLLSQKEGQLSSPVGAATLEMEGERVLIARKGSKIGNKETHTFGTDKEIERPVRKQGNTKVRSRTSNGNLKD